MADGTAIDWVAVVALQSRRQRIGYLSVFRTARERTVNWIGWHDGGDGSGWLERWQEQQQESAPWEAPALTRLQSLAQLLYSAAIKNEIQTLAFQPEARDTLTGLPSWELMQKRLAWWAEQARKRGKVLAVAVLNVNRFRAYNATLGGEAGDRLLQQLGQRLADLCQHHSASEQDLSPSASRWFGDRFLVLWPCGNGLSGAQALGEALVALFQDPFWPSQEDGSSVHLGGSVGIAMAPYDAEGADGLLQAAENAQGEARQRGRSSYQLCAEAVQDSNFGDSYSELQLRQAIVREQLRLRYQPQLDAATGQVLGVEALVRWQHPKWGQISPGKFIPLAEQTGLIRAIDTWVLEQACQQQVRWAQQGWPLRMSANLSAGQLHDPQLPERVRQTLQATGMEASKLELEITEKTAVENREQARENLRALQQLGVRIALDDFGQGHSSMAILRYLPVNTLKIDRSFVEAALQSEQDTAIVRILIELGHTLELELIAEGIETSEQRDLLCGLGCDSLQGYLFGKPQSAEELVQQPREQFAPSRQPAAANEPTGSDEQPPQDDTAGPDPAARYRQLNHELQQQLRREQLVSEVAQKIRDSLDLEEVFETTVNKVRTLLQTDRVLLYQFNSDWSGQVVEEAVLPDCQALKQQWVSDSCFPQEYGALYRQGRVRSVGDMAHAQVSECHRRMMAGYDVHANVVVPVVYGEWLWGLLIAHDCRQPRQWKQHELVLLRQLAMQAAIAIHQSELYQQLESTNEQLQELAAQDALTQLANRGAFDFHLRQEWNQLRRMQSPLSLILGDLDGFKEINDRWGHPAGDDYLKQVAAVLQASVARSGDLVARFGGDEFALLLPHTEAAGAQQVAEDIGQRIRELEAVYQGQSLPPLTASLGALTVVPDERTSIETALKFADRALYRAKANGGDCVEVAVWP